MREYYDVLKLVLGFLNDEHIPYMAVGAISVAIWGSPRTSQDIDIIIVIKEEDITRFARFCKKHHLSADEEEIKDALNEKSHVTVFDEESVYRLDVKGVYDELDRITFARRTKVHFRDFDLWVNTPEDSILAKLVYGSPQDLDDAKTMLLRQEGKLDLAYLKTQAQRFKVLQSLTVLMRELRTR
ncbi:hypothetical protein HY642_06535 [Candidatus Woesearchaeota archaeon]|nr:hypothetical protein [Candidatus Woesearchaeota archaeon]